MALTLDELKGTTPEAEATPAVETEKGTVVETLSGQKIKTFTPDEIGAPRKVENSLADNMAKELSVLDEGIQRNKEKLYAEYVAPQIEAEAEAALTGELDFEESEEAVSGQISADDIDDLDIELDESTPATMDDYKVAAPIEKVSEAVAVAAPEVSTTAPDMTSLKEDLGKDFFEDDEEEDTILEGDDAEEELEQVKAEIKSSIKPINNVVDLTKFTISKKPASSSTLLKSVNAVSKAADWVLYAAKKPITMTSLNEPPILSISKNTSVLWSAF